MAKKDFKSGLDSFITSTKKHNETALKEKFVTFNFLLKEEYHKELKIRAITKGCTLKELVNEIVRDYLNKE